MSRHRKPGPAQLARGLVVAAGTLAAAQGCADRSADESGSPPAALANERADASTDAGSDAASAVASDLGCSSADRLVPATTSVRSVLRAEGSTAFAADSHRSELSGCRDVSSGPDRWYALDLSGFAAAVEVQAVVDADFDALLELERGACGDTQALDCDRAQGLTDTGSSIAARLEPDLYWLIVDGASPASRGDFRLHVELDPTPGVCTDSAEAGSCGAPLRLEPLPRQTLLLDEACLPRGDDGAPTGWYELDLSGETRAVLVHAAAWTLSRSAFQHFYLYDAADGACEKELAASYLSRGLSRSNAELSALLAPGRYQLQLEFYREPEPRAGLDVQIDRETCKEGPVANHCEDALPIDPSLPRQVLEGNTACNNSRFQPFSTLVEAPEQFYRLDLRSAPGPMRARVTPLVDGLGLAPILALLTADNDGVCPGALYSDVSFDNAEGPGKLDLILDPQLHYIVIDGAEPGAGGPYQLLVELEPAARSTCVDARIDDCVNHNGETDCCHEWSPACDASAALCGLARSTQECVCAMAPACCGPERDASACHDAQQACNYQCPDYTPSETSCLAPSP